MLRRNSTRSVHKRPLGRSRSTSSIARSSVTGRFAINPSLAERDAHIAANLSFHRAHCCYRHILRAACECHNSREIMLRRSTSVDGRLERQPKGTQTKQSVRFTGPNARPRRKLASRAKPVTLIDRPAVVMNGFGGEQSAASVVDQDVVETTTASITPRAGLAASGVLRKSKSMYSCSHSAYSMPSYEGSYMQSTPARQICTTTSGVQMQIPDKEHRQYSIRRSLRAPKSMSYLDYRTNQSFTENVATKQDGLLSPITELAPKASFGRLKTHSSIFFRSRNRRQGSSLETSQSFRNSSENSTAISSVLSGNNPSSEKPSGIRFTARRVSRSLKHKLSRLFGRSQSTDTTETDTQVKVSDDAGSENFDHLANTPSVEDASISRVPSHVPSLHAVPSYQQMRSRQGSLESIPCEEKLDLDQRSRITSWTDSTANTIMTCDRIGEKDYQRLSVIKENVMHVSSHSRARSLEGPNLSADYGANPSPLIDSQRVYSALMKKLQNDMSAKGSVQNPDYSNHVSSKTVPPRQSSLDRAEAWSPNTVRGVSTEDDDVFEDSKEFASLRLPSSSINSRIEAKYEGSTGKNAHYKAYPNVAAGDGKGLSPNAKTIATESATRQAFSLHGRNSTFSPSPSNFLFRTMSPYRRALRKSIREQQELGHTHALDTRYLSTLSALSLPTRCPSTVESERDARLTYAESFYSFATEDFASSPAPEPMSCRRAADNKEEANQEMAHAMVTPIQGRDVSSASSVEWKTRLSAHVSKNDIPQSTAATNETGTVAGSGSAVGHVRESAEIESPADINKAIVRNRSPSVRVAEGSINIISPQSSRVCVSTNPDTTQTVYPGDDENSIEVFGADQTRSHAPLEPPPIPYRNVLRTVTSLPNVENTAVMESVKHEDIHHRRSLNNIPTWVSLAQDGIPRKRYDQENERSDASALNMSAPGHGTTTHADRVTMDTGSPLRCSKIRALNSPRTPARPMGSPDKMPGTVKSEWDAQVRGSRRMVDLFLSSRRKAIQGPLSRNGSDNFSAVFL